MESSIYSYILVMAIVTYLIRVVPLTVIRGQLNNNYIKSLLYYVPFVTLSVMTFPAVLDATMTIWSAWGGFLMAAILAYRGNGLLHVSLAACVSVFFIELVLC
jgi:branched-subunit amino acid transport protein